jgi:hypothetical protein
MPRCDGTGPTGMGPRTGRGLGPCAGYPTPGYTNPSSGRFSALGSIGRWAAGVLPRLGLGRRALGGGPGLGGGRGGRGRNRRF